MLIVDLADLLLPVAVLAFSKPRAPAMQAPIQTPVDDSAARAERENKARQAAVDLATSGRRSTIFGGTGIGLAAQVARIARRNSQAGTDLLA